jgi:serine/threonine protein kinase
LFIRCKIVVNFVACFLVVFFLFFCSLFAKFKLTPDRMLASGTVLGSKWSLVSQIGEGACAKVYSISDVKSSLDYEVVAKVIPLAKSKSKKDKEQERICNTLNYEYILYTGLLMDFPFAPRRPAKFFGDDLPSGVRYLVMERLDSDLVGHIKHNPVTPNSIATIGLQILEGLIWLHQKNFVFVDIKPENFMMKANKLYFVDCKLF